MTSQQRPYHHGDLRRALIDAAVATIAEHGPSAMSVRSVARRAGVTHAAATYHFGDKAGLLTAVAAEGYRLLGDELDAAARTQTNFLEIGVAYVRFAVRHRAHFEIMYRPELYRPDAQEVVRARAGTARILYRTEHADRTQLEAGVAAWAFVHGVATLWLAGNLPKELGDDPEAITRAVAAHLRPGPVRSARRGRGTSPTP